MSVTELFCPLDCEGTPRRTTSQNSMNIVKSAVGILFLLGTGITVVSAGELSAVPTTDVNKWQYNLFNPTPRALMREMSTDRPDKTESAYTVDGHFQFEADLVSFSIDRWNADGERGWRQRCQCESKGRAL
jgi:hypothetical protein